MSSVTVKDVRHVAMLARLGLTDERAAELAKELNTILEHMDELSRVKTDGVAESAAVGQAGMRLRDDRVNPHKLEAPLKSFAPAVRDGFITVPRLATHEGAGAGGGDDDESSA